MIDGSKRAVPAKAADRLIVALDVPTIREARELVAKLDSVASFFKLGPWLLCAEGLDFLPELFVGRGHGSST